PAVQAVEEAEEPAQDAEEPAQDAEEDSSPAEQSSTPAEAAGEDPEPAGAPAQSPGDRGLLSVPGAEFAEIPIHEVRENPRNPRTMFDEDELDELAYSLREVGVLQPVVVRPIPVTDDGESFELVMG